MHLQGRLLLPLLAGGARWSWAVPASTSTPSPPSLGHASFPQHVAQVTKVGERGPACAVAAQEGCGAVCACGSAWDALNTALGLRGKWAGSTLIERGEGGVPRGSTVSPVRWHSVVQGHTH